MDLSCNYPPDEILNPIIGKPNYEYIILWILSNNEVCSWSDLKEKVNKSTLYYELGQVRKGGRKLSYPPKVILSKRNYDHTILWMVYNNNYCKWADFLEEPLSINQSSLSKNMNLLMDNGFVLKENKEYRITRPGKSQYSQMLSYYDLDRQSILEEESKRIAELTNKVDRVGDDLQIILEREVVVTTGPLVPESGKQEQKEYNSILLDKLILHKKANIRSPYSLHEETKLVSLPIYKDRIIDFNPEKTADPKEIKKFPKAEMPTNNITNLAKRIA